MDGDEEKLESYLICSGESCKEAHLTSKVGFLPKSLVVTVFYGFAVVVPGCISAGFSRAKGFFRGFFVNKGVLVCCAGFGLDLRKCLALVILSFDGVQLH